MSATEAGGLDLDAIERTYAPKEKPVAGALQAGDITVLALVAEVRALRAKVERLVPQVSNRPIWGERPRTARDAGLVLDDTPVREIVGWEAVVRMVEPDWRPLDETDMTPRTGHHKPYLRDAESPTVAPGKPHVEDT